MNKQTAQLGNIPREREGEGRCIFGTTSVPGAVGRKFGFTLRVLLLLLLLNAAIQAFTWYICLNKCFLG